MDNSKHSKRFSGHLISEHLLKSGKSNSFGNPSNIKLGVLSLS
jgi:hypothetical protein